MNIITNMIIIISIIIIIMVIRIMMLIMIVLSLSLILLRSCQEQRTSRTPSARGWILSFRGRDPWKQERRPVRFATKDLGLQNHGSSMTIVREGEEET